MKTKLAVTKKSGLKDIAKLTELESLKREIISAHKSTGEFVKSARDKSLQALAEAVICGEKLNRAKSICGHGHFEKWCAAEIHQISKRTIQNYMLVSNSNKQGLADLSAMNKHAAYKLLGIIKDCDLQPDTSRTIALPHDAKLSPQPIATVLPQSIPTTAPEPIVECEVIPPAADPITAMLVAEHSLADPLCRAKALAAELTYNLITVINTNLSSVKVVQCLIINPLLAALHELE